MLKRKRKRIRNLTTHPFFQLDLLLFKMGRFLKKPGLLLNLSESKILKKNQLLESSSVLEMTNLIQHVLMRIIV
jgi:hypothetical protein